MKIISEKPLVLWGTAFLFTLFNIIYFEKTLPDIAIVCAIALVLLGAVLFFFQRNKKRRYLVLFFAILTASLLTAFLIGNITLSKSESIINKYCTGEALPSEMTVISVKKYNKTKVARVEVNKISDEDVSLAATVAFYNDEEEIIATANRITASVIFSPSAEGSSLYDKYSFSKGEVVSGEAEKEAVLISNNDSSFSVLCERLRQSVAELIDEKLGKENSALIKALTLADKSELSFSDKNNFSSLGISHMLAVSGLHLSILMGMISFVLKKLRARRGLSYVILTSALLFYIVITGFTPSMLRSGGMLLLFYLSHFTKRKVNSLTSLIASATVITLFSPTTVIDTGFLMSFSATLGIVTLSPIILEKLSLEKLNIKGGYVKQAGIRALFFVASSSAVTFSATGAILPVLYLADGELFLIAFISNIIFTPLLTLLLFLIPLFFITYPIPFLSDSLSGLLVLTEKLTLFLARLGKYTESFNFSLAYPFVAILLAIAALVFVIMAIASRKYCKLKSLLLLPILLFTIALPIGVGISDKALEKSESIFYFSDENKDALIITKGSKSLIVDFSTSNSFVKKALANASYADASIKADTLMLTSLRISFVSLIEELSERYEIKNLIIPEYNGDTANEIKSVAESFGINVIGYTQSSDISWCGISLSAYGKSYTQALSFEIANEKLLYLCGGATDNIDIILGPCKKEYTTVIFGAYKSPPEVTPIRVYADRIVYGTNSSFALSENAEIMRKKYFKRINFS